jgi:predicted amino acid-binding ACT domain protein
MEQNIEIKNGRGYAVIPKSGVLTFEVQGISEREDIRQKEYQNLYSRHISDNMTMKVGDFTVPLWGEGHNLYPQEVFSVTSDNKLLPEVIKKQVKFLFGKGPRLYQEVIQGEGEKKRRVRVPVDIPEIEDWLDNWEEMGYDSVWDYLKNRIVDFYYVNTVCSKWHYNISRRSDRAIKEILKIRALTYIGADEARLATSEKSLTKRIKNSDCKVSIRRTTSLEIFPTGRAGGGRVHSVCNH